MNTTRCVLARSRFMRAATGVKNLWGRTRLMRWTHPELRPTSSRALSARLIRLRCLARLSGEAF
jgi:hypothetical protein